MKKKMPTWPIYQQSLTSRQRRRQRMERIKVALFVIFVIALLSYFIGHALAAGFRATDRAEFARNAGCKPIGGFYEGK